MGHAKRIRKLRAVRRKKRRDVTLARALAVQRRDARRTALGLSFAHWAVRRCVSGESLTVDDFLQMLLGVCKYAHLSGEANEVQTWIRTALRQRKQRQTDEAT